MKKDPADQLEKFEAPVVKPAVQKPAKLPKKKKETDNIHLPVLVEFAFSFSIIILIIFSLSIIGISFLMGSSLLDLVVRTSVATLALGGLLMVIAWQISSGVLKSSQVEQEEPSKKKTDDSKPAVSSENDNKAEV